MWCVDRETFRDGTKEKFIELNCQKNDILNLMEFLPQMALNNNATAGPKYSVKSIYATSPF